MIKKVIYSPAEPHKSNLWLHYKDGQLILENYGRGGWESVTHIAETPEEPDTVRYVFFISSNDTSYNQHNLQTASKIGLNNYVNIELKGTYYQDNFDVYGFYHDGIIITSFGQFDVNFITGEVTKIYEEDNTTAVPLQVANTGTEEAAENKKLLMAASIYPVFFCRFDVGYGTATFNSGNGGSAFVTTATGHAVLYTIDKNGGIVKTGEYNLMANPIN